MSDVKVLKLTTGEEIIARVEQQRDYMMLEKPMTMAPVPGQSPGQMGFAMVPWMMAAKGDFIQLSLSHIVVETEAKGEIEKNYLASITGLSL
jgi:hypothetical protein|tara:strand:+ start:167 stop:442 length:276 start_codon:yes stop_codon:yes gene_type:complete